MSKRYKFTLLLDLFFTILLAILMVGLITMAAATKCSAPDLPPATTETVTTAPPETTVAPSTEAPTEPTIPTETETIPPTEIETEPPTEPPLSIEEILESMIPEGTKKLNIKWYSDYRVKPSYLPTTEVYGEPVNIEFLAKLLFAEAGSMNWWGQVYTCSAILNHCDTEKISLWDAGHNKNHFSVAPYVDTVEPTERTYQVIEYVLAGGRIEEICYFRSGGKYHKFGVPVCQVGAHYFSIKEKRK